MALDFVEALEESATGMPVETAQRLVVEYKEKIRVREMHGGCECGTLCENPISHNAVDHLILLKMEEIVRSTSQIESPKG